MNDRIVLLKIEIEIELLNPFFTSEMDPLVRDRLSLIAAFGCGLALSATLTGIYSKIKSEHSKSSLKSKIEGLADAIDQLKKDVEEIKVISLRGSSPYSIRPSCIERWDIDRLENIAESDFLANDAADSISRRKGSQDSVNPDTSDDNDEFFDFTESAPRSHVDAKESEPTVPISDQDDQEKSRPCGSSYEEWLKLTDKLLKEAKTDKKALYDRISKGITQYGETAPLLWRKAKAAHLLSVLAEKDGDKDRRKNLIFETLKCAEKAVELDENSADCHKWYAIALGSATEYVGTKERIESGYKFKNHVDRAIELNPSDETLYYLLGRWASEVSNLTWIEKRLASTLFAAVPETTAQEALQSLLKAHSLRPNWKQNIYYICKTLIAMKRREEALEWITKGLKCPVEDEDDQITHEKLLSLKSKHFKS
ncbi:regulator of microtubule dynamics protein 1-like isoform X2 [Brevipalpus obovatus]|uniref:regulator of microtubule dynamics protein 1-like isoform X2 n=2 Tax=Brevipalpus obovatus TaxID=246614 RepID=UPI003D9E5301